MYKKFQKPAKLKNVTWTHEEKRYFAKMIIDKVSVKIKGKAAFDYAFKLTEIPKFKYLNAEYTGIQNKGN